MIETIDGVKISDPYRWLENANDPKVKTWIKDQNKITNSILRDNNYKIFSEELAKNFKVVNFSNPVPVNGRYFYTERQPDQDQMFCM